MRPQPERASKAWHALPAEALGDEARAVFDALCAALEAGQVRAAEPGPDGWTVNAWVKKRDPARLPPGRRWWRCPRPAP